MQGHATTADVGRATITDLPPSGHTGAGNTVSGTVDYLELTFKDLPVEEVLHFFTPSDVGWDWAALPCGRNGYRTGMVRGDLRVYWDGGEGMGVHVAASGAGCRQLEAEGQVGRWEGPKGYAARLLAAGAQVSRIDVAFDDRTGYLTPQRIESAITEGRCVSRFHKADPRSMVNLKDGTRGGWSVYLGASSSRVRVRFYDKAAEQREKGCDVQGHWMRCELQARDQRADWVLAQLAGDGLAAVAGLLLGYVQFKEGGDDSNRSRWRNCRWWMEFLCDVEKRTLSVAQVVQTVERAAEWFRRQVAPTFALLRFSDRFGDDWLEQVFAAGAERLKPWQLASLQPLHAVRGA